MKFTKKLQNHFKNFFQKLFILLYGKISFNSNYNFLIEHSSNKLYEVIIDNFRYNCFKITNGRIYTDLVENVAVISNNNLVKGASSQKINGELKSEIENICLKKGTPRIKIKKKGTLFALIQDASENNYAHWLIDILPRLKIFEINNSIEKIDYFLLPEIKYNYHYETLERLNIPLNKVLSDKRNRHIESETLIVTDHPWYKNATIYNEMNNVPEWIVLWLREKFLKEAEYKNLGKKIYIDRSDSLFNHCKIINSSDVWKFLEKKGFTKIKLTEINFKNQVGLFNSANVIIGPHGAGLSNIIFSNPETKIIEIKPENNNNEFFSTISEINNLNYKKIISKDLKLNIENKPGDIFVDLNDIEKLIN